MENIVYEMNYIHLIITTASVVEIIVGLLTLIPNRSILRFGVYFRAEFPLINI